MTLSFSAVFVRDIQTAAELIALPSPLVVALNMMDVATKEGIHIEPDVLEATLGVPVVPITATRAAGTCDLFRVEQETLDGQRPATPRLPEIHSDHRQVLAEISQDVAGHVP